LQAIVQVMPGLSADVPRLTRDLCNNGYGFNRAGAIGAVVIGRSNQSSLDFVAQVNQVAAAIQQGASAPGRDVLAEAHTWLGVPYLYGGCSRQGVDCSCLVQLVYRAVGMNLPRVASDQFNATSRISSEQAQPGDLVFFANTYMPGISHVGIYIGNGQQINAPTTGQVVSVQPVFSGYWGAHLAGFGRVRRPATSGGQA
jgi:cell wall-associated NlpC family hydrolase